MVLAPEVGPEEAYIGVVGISPEAFHVAYIQF